MLSEKNFFEKINNCGGSAYLVGGAVRDILMHRTIHDKDYVICGLKYDELKKLFPNAIRIGKNFPVFNIEIDGKKCDVAFARREQKNGLGYKGFQFECSPKITIEEDLFRRDTTINSMALDAKGNLIDPYGGKNDIENKIIRKTSEHFYEDPVRALRAARQSAQFCFIIEENTLSAMKKCAGELIREPAERKFSELEKALSAEKPSLYFRALLNADLLKQEYPEIYNLIGKTQPVEYHPEGDAFEHTMIVTDTVAIISSRPEVRFAALMHDIGKSLTDEALLPHHYGHELSGAKLVGEIADRMKLPNLWKKCAVFAAYEHMRPKKMKKPSKIHYLIRALENEPIGPDGFSAIISADNHGEVPDFLKKYDKLLQIIKNASKNVQIPEKLKGAQIGEYLRQLELRALENEICCD